MDNRAVNIYTAANDFDARMIMAAFKENGITAFKRDLGAAGLRNLYCGTSDDGAQIYVYKEDLEKAREILIVMGFAEE